MDLDVIAVQNLQYRTLLVTNLLKDLEKQAE